MRKITLAVALVTTTPLLAVTPALAQTVPATSDAVPPAALAEAKTVVSLLHVSDGFRASVPALKPLFASQALGAIGQQNDPTFNAYLADPAKKAQLSTILGDEFAKAFTAQAAALEEQVARAYAKRLTLDDLRTLAAFLHTPAGARWASIQPQLQTDLQQAGQSIGAVAGMQAMAAAATRAKAEIK